MLLSEAVERYIIEYLIIKGVDDNQVVHYRSMSRLFCEIVGDKNLNIITLEDVAEFQNKLHYVEKNRCNNTVRNYICELRMILRYWGLRGEDCLNYELIPSPNREPNVPAFLTAEEVQRLIDSTDLIRTKLVISLLYSSGIRVSELQQLNRDSIRDGQFTVIGKGRKVRICFIDDRTEQFLKEYLSQRKDRSEALLVGAQSQRISVSTIQLIIRNATEKAGLKKKITPHTFRHSFATNYISNDGNIRHLASLLGHSSVNTTAHYSHLVDNDLKAAYQRHHSV